MRSRAVVHVRTALILCLTTGAGLSGWIEATYGATSAPPGEAIEVFRGRPDRPEDVLTGEYLTDETGQPVARKPQAHPYLTRWYDGRRNLPLAVCMGRTLTEQDLFLFRLMKREPRPDLVDIWEKTARPSEREKLTRDLEEAVRAMAQALTLAELGPSRPFQIEDEKFIRFLKYPVYQMIWIEKILKPSIRIEEIDLIKYYHDHVGDFYKPESVRVRYIFFASSPDASISDREQVEAEAREVHRQLVGGADFVELARMHSDAPSGVRGGELPPLQRGMYFEEFENYAFDLQPGAISPVFRGPGGFYLLQCLERIPESQTPFQAALPKLREAVERKTLSFLYEYQLNRLVMRNRRSLKTWRLREMGFDDVLIEIGLYRMTKGEFLSLFPQVIGEAANLEGGILAATAGDILRGELVAQIVEREGFGDDPLLQAADSLARKIRTAQNALRARLAVPVKFSEAALREFYDKNREALGDQPLWRVLQFDAVVRNPYLRHPTQMTALSGELLDLFQKTLDEFQSAFREERARAFEERILVGERPSTAPLTVALIPEDAATTEAARVRRWLSTVPRCLAIIGAASNNDFLFTVKDLGYRSYRDKAMYEAVKELRDGEFSRIQEIPGGYSVYFVERRLAGIPAEYDPQNPQIRREYIRSQQTEVLDRLRAEIERKASLRIQLPEIGSPRE
ncbi:MAG: peptidyl-prolyl cis-trans isomerase [Candidatus Sumerlaeia bacterium]|nr:peptidyl-prolyl cis-trans isomerase [Candidatus Sumerlaeia bacterium]